MLCQLVRRVSVFVFICVYLLTRARACVCVCVRMCVCARVYVCVCVCVYVLLRWLSLCTYVCTVQPWWPLVQFEQKDCRGNHGSVKAYWKFSLKSADNVDRLSGLSNQIEMSAGYKSDDRLLRYPHDPTVYCGTHMTARHIVVPTGPIRYKKYQFSILWTHTVQ